MRETNKTELRLLKDTGSPSGRYAIAWGVPGVSRLDQFPEEMRPDEEVRNFIVEKRTGKVVGTIPLHTRSCSDAGGGCAYKEGGSDWHGWGNSGKSHSHISTHWDSFERWAVVLNSGKWWYEAIYLCHRQADTFKFVEIGDKVEDLVRAHLLKTRRAVYQRFHGYDCRNPFVDVASVKIAPPHITLWVGAGIPKKENDPLGLSGTLELRIRQHLNDLSVSPVSLKVKYTDSNY